MGFQVLHASLWIIILTALAVAAWKDLKTRLIPDELTGIVAASGFVLGLMLRPEQAIISLPAAVVVFLGLGVLSHFNLMGGGDVKLISAATLLVPPERIGHLLLAIVLAGGVLSCVYIIARIVLRSASVHKSPVAVSAAEEVSRNTGGWFSNECSRICAGGQMPYALAIVGGVIGAIAGELSQCLSGNFCSL
ncbi:MAG: prepilin peptidase [Alphaproteobacteria bacterium]